MKFSLHPFFDIGYLLRSVCFDIKICFAHQGTKNTKKNLNSLLGLKSKSKNVLIDAFLGDLGALVAIIAFGLPVWWSQMDNLIFLFLSLFVSASVKS